ncbi:hypothetical protein FBQ81_03390 [Chloroflexi bacterium CFX6]|nr:hypothetical protein [Chloroflexi bacterium CFX6]
MDKGFVSYVLVFTLLMAAAVAFSNVDGITPAIAHAEADLAVGTTTVQAVEQGASWLLKLTVGAVVTGIAAAAFTEFRRAYKTWQRNSKRKRWQAGPNAQWKQGEQLPKLRREDLLLLALSGRMPAEDVRNSPRRGMIRARDEEKEAELEMP